VALCLFLMNSSLSEFRRNSGTSFVLLPLQLLVMLVQWASIPHWKLNNNLLL